MFVIFRRKIDTHRVELFFQEKKLASNCFGREVGEQSIEIALIPNSFGLHTRSNQTGRMERVVPGYHISQVDIGRFFRFSYFSSRREWGDDRTYGPKHGVKSGKWNRNDFKKVSSQDIKSARRNSESEIRFARQFLINCIASQDFYAPVFPRF